MFIPHPVSLCAVAQRHRLGLESRSPRVLFVYLVGGRECPLQLSQGVSFCAFAKDRIRHVEVVRGRVSLCSPEPRDGGYEAGYEEGQHAGDEV